MSCFILQLVLPAIVRAVYVRPNEISIERPYIEGHIQATTAAFGLNRNATESPFTPSGQGVVDPVQDATLLKRCALTTLSPKLTSIAISSMAGSNSSCCPEKLTLPSYRPKRARAGSILVSFTRTALAWLWQRLTRLRLTACPSCSSRTLLRRSNRLGFSSRGRKSILVNEPRIDLVFVHAAREEFDYPSGDQNKYSTYQNIGRSSSFVGAQLQKERLLPGQSADARHFSNVFRYTSRN